MVSPTNIILNCWYISGLCRYSWWLSMRHTLNPVVEGPDGSQLLRVRRRSESGISSCPRHSKNYNIKFVAPDLCNAAVKPLSDPVKGIKHRRRLVKSHQWTQPTFVWWLLEVRRRECRFAMPSDRPVSAKECSPNRLPSLMRVYDIQLMNQTAEGRMVYGG